jgi:hypothetical protein
VGALKKVVFFSLEDTVPLAADTFLGSQRNVGL